METQIVMSALAEASKTWGSYALCLILLGGFIWHLIKQGRAKDETIADLRSEMAEIHEARLEDARKMTLVAQTGTETMVSRTKGDGEFRSLLTSMVDEMAAMRVEIRDLRARRQGSR